MDDTGTRKAEVEEEHGHYYRTSDRRSDLAAVGEQVENGGQQQYDGDYYDYGGDSGAGASYGQTFNWDDVRNDYDWRGKHRPSVSSASDASTGTGVGKVSSDLMDVYSGDAASAIGDTARSGEYLDGDEASGSGLSAGGGDLQEDIIRPSTRVDSIQDILASRRDVLDSMLKSKNGVIGDLVNLALIGTSGGKSLCTYASFPFQISSRRDPGQPATIQKILRETTREGILPKQTLTLDDIFKDSEDRKRDKMREAAVDRVNKLKMDLDKQPRLVDRRKFVPATRLTIKS